MGQKSNSNILRLGINNIFWSSKYIEKISEESSLFIYQDLEIRSFINRFFDLNGLLIDKCFINRYGSQIVICISYFVLLFVFAYLEFNNRDRFTNIIQNISEKFNYQFLHL